MPQFRSARPPGPPANPDDWRPQQFGRGGRSSAETLVEPGWDGVRVIARFDSGRSRFSDEDGVDCSAEFADVAEALTLAAQANDLILDGYLTVQATQITAGVPLSTIEAPTPGQMMASMVAGGRAIRPTVSEHPLDLDRPIAFVAVDLLRIDGSSLLDVPLLERKRLLDGVIEQSERIRVTPYVREPFGSYLVSWRGLGFQRLFFKAANSRYLPNARNDAWSAHPMPVK
jgi:bifunctional non-homologous end joining protein LigD